jgi:diacylglycerol kinase family enzyme
MRYLASGKLRRDDDGFQTAPHLKGRFFERVGMVLRGAVSATIPFCILPLGTANNCAKSLGQMHTLESIVLALKSERIKKLDVGMVTSSTGDRIFLESIGIGLLAESMIEMLALEKKNRFKIRLSSEERLTLA